MTIVLSATPSVSSFLSRAPTCSSCSSIFARTTSSSARPSSTALRMYFFCGCDQMWHAVVLNQQKNGFLALADFVSHLTVSSSTSESNVSIRLRVSIPVFLIFCLPTRPNFGSVLGSSLLVAHACRTPRGPYVSRYFGFFCPG